MSRKSFTFDGEKLFTFDTETTGVDRKKNSMVQLAGLIEIGGTVVEKVNLLFRPLPGREIEQEALDINRRTKEEIMAFPPAQVGIASLKKTFSKYVGQYDPHDKFVPAGFNVNFDTDFLRETWSVAGDKYGPGSWLFNCPIDIRTDVAKLILKRGLRLPNYKLSTICEHFGIKTDNAHDAVADVEMTRNLAKLAHAELRG